MNFQDKTERYNTIVDYVMGTFAFVFFQPVTLDLLRRIPYSQKVNYLIWPCAVTYTLCWPVFVGWLFVYHFEFYGGDFTTSAFALWPIGMVLSWGVGLFGLLLLPVILGFFEPANR